MSSLSPNMAVIGHPPAMGSFSNNPPLPFLKLPTELRLKIWTRSTWYVFQTRSFLIHDRRMTIFEDYLPSLSKLSLFEQLLLFRWTGLRIARLCFKARPMLWCTVGHPTSMNSPSTQPQPHSRCCMQNREAREIPLKVYEKAFATSLRKPVYFDFERDTVYGDLNTITIFPQNCRIHSLMPCYNGCRECWGF
jgi:hypothetical protein